MAEIAKMPWIQIFLSPACNLDCKYCSNPRKDRRNETDKAAFHILESDDVVDIIKDIPPTHLYVSGGEPLIHPGIKEFINTAIGLGHYISFDTNISISLKKIRELFESWDPDHIGFVNISHHMICDISFDYIRERVELLKSLGARHFVKYVGVPQFLSQIEKNMDAWGNIQVGSAVTILQGMWDGRILPQKYTLKETSKLLNMVTLYTHGLQIFNGFRSFGTFCRGGQDFLCWNMNAQKEFIPCCHGNGYYRKYDQTFFKTGSDRKLRCPIASCLGDVMFIFGINGVLDETDRFGALCDGQWDFLGMESVVDFTDKLVDNGYDLYNREKFDEIKSGRPWIKTDLLRFGKRLSPIQSAPKRLSKKIRRKFLPPSSPVVVPRRFKGKTGEEVLEKIEDYISQWKTPEEVISKNPRNDWHNVIRIQPDASPEVLARFAAKRVAQEKFRLPEKINVEASAICPLQCEYCVLSDLKKFRRKSLMSYEDFLKIWKYMEVFTTLVEFTGGEPLLNKDLPAMITKARETGVYSRLATNGNLFKDETIEKILEAQPSEILIAYDSGDEEKYEGTRRRGKLSKLRQNTEHLISRKRDMKLPNTKIALLMVIHKKNQYDIQTFYEDAKNLGADYANVKPVLAWPGQDKEYEEMMIRNYLIPGHPKSYHKVDEDGNLLKLRKPGVCPNVQRVHIGSGSEVIPCWYILKNTFVAGYAADIPFLEIWYGEEYVEYRRKMFYETANKACPGCIGMPNYELWKEIKL